MYECMQYVKSSLEEVSALSSFMPYLCLLQPKLFFPWPSLPSEYEYKDYFPDLSKVS